MVPVHSKFIKNIIEIELSVQKYVDPCIFVFNLEIFFDHLEPGLPAGRTYTRPAVLEMPPTYNKRQPKGCNKNKV